MKLRYIGAEKIKICINKKIMKVKQGDVIYIDDTISEKFLSSEKFEKVENTDNNIDNNKQDLKFFETKSNKKNKKNRR